MVNIFEEGKSDEVQDQEKKLDVMENNPTKLLNKET